MRVIPAFIFFILSLAASAQTDTTLAAFKKFFHKKIVRPYFAYYQAKDFKYDSIRAATEHTGYIRYKTEVKPAPSKLRLPDHIVKRFVRIDSVKTLASGDTLHAEFYSHETVINNHQLYGMIIERQMVGYYYRSSEKYLCTFDKRYRPVDVLMLASSIPPDGPSIDNFDRLRGSFERLPWFVEETEGLLRKDLTIEHQDAKHEVKKYRINHQGRIVKNEILNKF